MTMLTALRELAKPYQVRVRKAPFSFEFECYGDTVYMTERIVYLKGAEYTIDFVWKKMNEE